MYTPIQQTQPLVNYPAGTVPFALNILIPPEYASIASVCASSAIATVQEARMQNGLRMAMFNDMAVNGFDNPSFKLLVENILFYMRMMVVTQGAGQTQLAFLMSSAVRAVTELTACQYVNRPELSGRLDSVTLSTAVQINTQNQTVWTSLAQLKSQLYPGNSQLAQPGMQQQMLAVPQQAAMPQGVAAYGTAAALLGGAGVSAPAPAVANPIVGVQASPVETFSITSPMDQSLPVPNEDNSQAPRISQKAIATITDIASVVGTKLSVRHQVPCSARVRQSNSGEYINPPEIEQLYDANTWVAFDIQSNGFNPDVPQIWYEELEDHMNLDKKALLGIPDTKPAFAAAVKANHVGIAQTITELDELVTQINAPKERELPARLRFSTSENTLVVGSHQQAWQMLECAGTVSRAMGNRVSVVGRNAVLHEILSSNTPLSSLITQLCAQRDLKDVATLMDTERQKIEKGQSDAIGENAFARLHARLTVALSDLYMKSLALPWQADSFIEDVELMEIKLTQLGEPHLSAYRSQINAGWIERVLNTGTDEFKTAIINTVLFDNEVYEEVPDGEPDIVVLSKPMYYMHVGLSSEHLGVEFDRVGVSRSVNERMAAVLWRVASYATTACTRSGATNALIRFQDGLTIDVRRSVIDPNVILASLA